MDPSLPFHYNIVNRKHRVPSEDRLSISQPDIRPDDDADEDEDDDDDGEFCRSEAASASAESKSASKRASGAYSRPSNGNKKIDEDLASFSSPDAMKRKKKADAIARDMLMV